MVTKSEIIPHLILTPTPYPHIGVGAEGRGREYTRFPVGRQFAESLAFASPCRHGKWGDGAPTKRLCSLCGTEYQPWEQKAEWYIHPPTGTVTEYRPIERASVIRTREKGTLLLVEERDPADRRALVLVNIAAGFRGGTEWTGTDREPCPKRGQKSDYFWACNVCGVGLEQDNMHPADRGWVYASFPPAGVTVLAEGYEAQGTAGRMGGHVVRLLMMEPGSVIRVVRLGRLYGAPAARYVAWDGESLRLGTRDEIWPPTEEAAEGEVI